MEQLRALLCSYLFGSMIQYMDACLEGGLPLASDERSRLAWLGTSPKVLPSSGRTWIVKRRVLQNCHTVKYSTYVQKRTVTLYCCVRLLSNNKQPIKSRELSFATFAFADTSQKKASTTVWKIGCERANGVSFTIIVVREKKTNRWRPAKFLGLSTRRNRPRSVATSSK